LYSWITIQLWIESIYSYSGVLLNSSSYFEFSTSSFLSGKILNCGYGLESDDKHVIADFYNFQY